MLAIEYKVNINIELLSKSFHLRWVTSFVCCFWFWVPSLRCTFFILMLVTDVNARLSPPLDVVCVCVVFTFWVWCLAGGALHVFLNSPSLFNFPPPPPPLRPWLVVWSSGCGPGGCFSILSYCTNLRPTPTSQGCRFFRECCFVVTCICSMTSTG